PRRDVREIVARQAAARRATAASAEHRTRTDPPFFLALGCAAPARFFCVRHRLRAVSARASPRNASTLPEGLSDANGARFQGYGMKIALSPLEKLRAAGKFLDVTFNKRPLTVSIEVTKRCNARCDFCDYWKISDRDEMTDFTDVVRRSTRWSWSSPAASRCCAGTWSR